MKILPVEKIREGDEYTIRHEPIADIDLMERAAGACFEWLAQNVPTSKRILVFCGTGNNGGDGLVIARKMSNAGYKVGVWVAGTEKKFSPNCKINYDRIQVETPVKVRFMNDPDGLPDIHKTSDVVIDALFGSGLNKPVTGLSGHAIDHINKSGALVVSIDVPSGLMCDSTMKGLPKSAVITADYTLTFAPLKLAFVFPENEFFIGNWVALDIGISPEFIEKADTRDFFLLQQDVVPLLKSRPLCSHKGNFGHAFLLCGSSGKMGAAVLCSRAALRAGAGLVTLHIPHGGNPIIQTAVPEAMTISDESDDFISSPGDILPFNSIAIGPGIGTRKETASALKRLIQNSPIPLILDADAINILGENKTWLSFLPKGSILTPHPKEFERIAGKTSDHFDRNRVQRELSVKYGLYIILKGAHTAVTNPEGKCWFNSTGNPGMATGGSGDVLTGILAGLKAQGYSSLETCLLGTYLHGLAGDLAAEEFGQEAMIAGDIIDFLGKAFLLLHGSKPLFNSHD